MVGHESLGGLRQVSGVGAADLTFSVDIGSVNRSLVLDDERTFASVNANALAQSSKDQRARLIMHGVPAEQWTQALAPGLDDDKIVADLF